MTLRRSRLRALGGALVLAPALLAGCDKRDLVGPSTRAPRATTDAPVSVGSAVLTPPGTSGPADVAGISPQQFASIPEAGWVVVTVSGMLTASRNPLCDQQPPYWPCMDGPVTMAFGSDPWDGGPVKLWTNQELYGRSAVRLRGNGGAGTTAGSAVGLARFYRPGTMDGQLNLIAQWAWDPNSGNGPASWLLGGSYAVTATAVPSPFRVTESAPDADGTVTYTAEPLYGLRFSNPLEWYWYWPAGAATWAFYPGDSLPDTPDRSWPGWTISECQFQLVCRWKPPVAGRMQVQAYVEGQAADARSKPEAAPCAAATTRLRASCGGGERTPPSLSCPPVTRGDNVTCTVSGTDVAVTGWSWTDAQGFETVTAPGGSLTWTGPGVTEGTVTASITVGGAAAPDLTAPLTVNPRTWSWGQAQWSYIPGAALICFSQRPVVGASAEWGWNVKKGSCDPGRILPDMLKNPQSGYDLAQVPDGPNKGYWYVTAAKFRMDMESNINPELTFAGRFYPLTPPQAGQCKHKLGQTGPGPVLTNFHGFNTTCKGVDLGPMFTGIWAHEGMGVANNSGHEAQGRIAAALPQNDPYAAVEGLVNRDEAMVRSMISTAVWERDSRISNFSASHAHVKNNWCGSVWLWDLNANEYIHAQVKANGQCI